MILKYTVLILVLIKIATSYKQYKYHELCPGNKFKTIFDKITNNKPEVKLNQGIQSAALLRYHSNSTTYKKIGSCEFDVKLDNPGSNKGIFASIKKLNLRERSYSNYGGDSSCVDYIRFTYKNGTSTRQICGSIETTVQNNLIRNFFDEENGEIRVEVYIDTGHSLSSFDKALEVDLVFTAYSSCFDDLEKVKCSPEKCISDVFIDDKILNCPPPGCSDESTCVNNEKPYIVPVKKDSSGSSSSAHIIVPIVVVIVAALVCILCFCKKKKTTTNSQRPNDHVEELRPTARSDLDSYLEFQDVRSVPLVSNQQHNRPMPQAPEEYERPMPLVPPEQRYDRPMPTVPPQHQYDRPMPSAPLSGFRDDPPPYDALFNSNPKKANL